MRKILAAALLLFSPTAHADVIQATFTGIIVPDIAGYYDAQYGGGPVVLGGLVAESTLWGLGVTMSYTIDSATAVVTQPSPGFTELMGRLSMSITVAGVNTFTPLGAWGFVTFADDFSSVLAYGQGNSNLEYIFQSLENIYQYPAANGNFQIGPCPGAPCGLLNITTSAVNNLSATSLSDPAPVPGPLAGTGLPGLIVLAALWLRRRKPWALGPNG